MRMARGAPPRGAAAARPRPPPAAPRPCIVQAALASQMGVRRTHAPSPASSSPWRRPTPPPARLPPLHALADLANLGDAVADPLLPLGLDFLTFLAATVLVVPAFKSARVSPVLGFLFSGLVLGQLGLFRNTDELEKLSELGVLFLLFEMGLELSFDRLRSLAKYAFGLGTVTMGVTTLIFACMGLPIGEGLGTEILVRGFHADRALVSIRTLDEAVVIGAALSLSSSAFVLQLLNESGQMATRAGSATLGILLLQDIAVVPFLVLLPILETTKLAGGESTVTLLASLAPTAAKTVLGLGVLLLGGRFLLRRVFELVAEARSDETFVALCLLSVTGASLATQRLGFSDTLGAFSAGVLLAETNYRTQVEADIRPFRGILLGLFFVTTGASLDVQLLLRDWQLVFALLAGLIAIKVGTIGTFAPAFGLTRAEAARTAFSLAQGGEFAFVLLELAKELQVLPDELNRLLIIVVVLSMALTPALVEVGNRVALKYEAEADAASASASALSERGDGGSSRGGAPPIVVCGFGELGQMVANAVESPLSGAPPPYVAFDLNPGRVRAAREAGFNVLYGDGSRAQVLEAAGAGSPAALVVCYTARGRAVAAVRALREALPGVPVYARALDSAHAAELKAAGATDVVTANVEAGLELTARVLSGMGVGTAGGIAFLQGLLRSQMDVRAAAAAAALAASPDAEAPAYDSTIFKLNPAPLLPEAEGGGGAVRPASDSVQAADPAPPSPAPPPMLGDGSPDGSIECPVDWEESAP
jgi:Kef-type K+ transport system membrane component KefB/voltage-gated potassium channel Kch